MATEVRTLALRLYYEKGSDFVRDTFFFFSLFFITVVCQCNLAKLRRSVLTIVVRFCSQGGGQLCLNLAFVSIEFARF